MTVSPIRIPEIAVSELVTRVEVIDESGRAFVRHYFDTGVSVSIQDNGRTLKVYAGKPQERYNGQDADG